MKIDFVVSGLRNNGANVSPVQYWYTPRTENIAVRWLVLESHFDKYPLIPQMVEKCSSEGYCGELIFIYTPPLSLIALGMGFWQSQLYPSEGYMREFTVHKL